MAWWREGGVAGAMSAVGRDMREGRGQRSLALVTAFAALACGFEAWVQHRRGAFANPLMYLPVWLTPPTVLAALAAVVSERAARTALPLLSLVSLVDGLLGFVMHLRGIRRMPGGFALGQYNVVMGPPVFAPLLTCSVGAIGLLAEQLRREAPARGPGYPLAALAAQLARGAAVERRPGSHRWLALVSALLAVLAGGEAYFEHLRGSFNQRWMWTPVWATPPMALAGIGAALSPRVATTVLPVVSAVTFLDGLLGFCLHLRGIRRMPGHFTNLEFNLTLGPPLFAPLLLCSVGLLGFITALLHRRRVH